MILTIGCWVVMYFAVLDSMSSRVLPQIDFDTRISPRAALTYRSFYFSLRLPIFFYKKKNFFSRILDRGPEGVRGHNVLYCIISKSISVITDC